jgi:hypothetical protein
MTLLLVRVALSHPDDASKTRSLPETPRSKKRHRGLLAAIVAFAVIASAACRYSQLAPASVGPTDEVKR